MIAQTGVQIIAHPTDFSDESAVAFAHALRMALATKSQLYLLHVKAPGRSDTWTSFPLAALSCGEVLLDRSRRMISRREAAERLQEI